MARFKIHAATDSAGFTRAYVLVDENIEDPNTGVGNICGSHEVCLSYNAMDAAELNSEIDYLIGELKNLKSKSYSVFRA